MDALVLELGGMDMVLGVAWLSTLGNVIMDWKAMTMQFSYEHELVTLQGQGSKMVRQCYLNSYLEDTHSRTELGWWWGHLQSMEATKSVVPKGLKPILEEF